MNKQTILLRAFGIFMVSMLIFSSCVSKKRKGEVSKLARAYHNTTALYNGYFNANELMETNLKRLREQHKDNYNQILPIYPEYEISKPESIGPDMDKAIEKVSIVAVTHEPSHWIDDCYIMIGRAQFMKQDYETAEETFTYFIEEFDPSVTHRRSAKKSKKKSKKKKSVKKKKKKKKKVTKKKKRSKKKKKKKKVKKKKSSDKKKKRETPEERTERLAKEKAARTEARKNAKLLAEKQEEEAEKQEELKRQNKKGFFKHKSAYPAGLLWLSKTYVKRDKHSLIDYYLNKITEQSDVDPLIRKEIPVVKAYNALHQKDYENAVVHLEEAIPLEKKKKRRARLRFIQAQIYQKLGNEEAAYAGFNEVSNMSTNFLMEFNAALNMLKNSIKNGSVKEAKKKLKGMLAEAKYDNFKDQIYYTIGEIEEKQNNIDKAIPNFRNAIKHNQDNTPQLVESYYKLARIFYDKEDYVMSKNYYDSTAQVMPKVDQRKPEVQSFAENLEAIAENINIIKLQDSLILIAQMPEEERIKIAKQLRKDELLAEAKKAQKLNNNSTLGSSKPTSFSAVGLGGRQSTFFAYDPNKVRIGTKDFQSLWGVRKLEDNWRRSNKTELDLDIDEILDNDNLELADAELQRLLKDVPMSADAMNQSKRKIRKALFELGVLYRDRIQNYKKAIETHETLQTRFPGSENEADALYYLYLSNLDIQDKVRANYYLNLLKTKYPTNKYTLALTDPNYVKQFINDQKKEEILYNQAYQQFQNNDFKAVLATQRKSFEQFGTKNKFASKYALLAAMAKGKLEGKEAYINDLNRLVAIHKGTPEQTRAKEILRFLRGDAEAFVDINQNEAKQNFMMEKEKTHYVIIVLDGNKSNNLQDAKISISNYNRKYHKLDKIKTSSSTLNIENETELILLRRFKNKNAAMKYYKQALRNRKEFIETKMSYSIFPISQHNFREIMKQKSIKEYEVFFKSEYLKI